MSQRYQTSVIRCGCEARGLRSFSILGSRVRGSDNPDLRRPAVHPLLSLRYRVPLALRGGRGDVSGGGHPPIDGVACAISRPLMLREGGVCSRARVRGDDR